MRKNKRYKSTSKIEPDELQVSDFAMENIKNEKEISHHSNNRIDRAIANAKASVEMEGLQITEDMEKLVRRKLTGEISEREFLDLAKNHAKSK